MYTVSTIFLWYTYFRDWCCFKENFTIHYFLNGLKFYMVWILKTELNVNIFHLKKADFFLNNYRKFNKKKCYIYAIIFGKPALNIQKKLENYYGKSNLKYEIKLNNSCLLFILQHSKVLKYYLLYILSTMV